MEDPPGCPGILPGEDDVLHLGLLGPIEKPAEPFHGETSPPERAPAAASVDLQPEAPPERFHIAAMDLEEAPDLDGDEGAPESLAESMGLGREAREPSRPPPEALP